MYWVFLSVPAVMKTQNITAAVVGPMSQAAFTAKYGNPNNGVNPSGGFATKLQAQAAANKYNANPGQAGGVNAPGVAPGINAPNPLGNNPLTGLNAIGDFFQRLSQPATWVRVGEFIAGGLLLYVALNAMTRGPARSEAVRTTKQVLNAGKKVAKVAAK
jgi:hypothetical protein